MLHLAAPERCPVSLDAIQILVRQFQAVEIRAIEVGATKVCGVVSNR